MKAYEFPVKVSPEGRLDLPDSVLELLPRDQMVRVIILLPESDDSEDADWERLTAEQFLAGYDEADSVYDRT